MDKTAGGRCDSGALSLWAVSGHLDEIPLLLATKLDYRWQGSICTV